MYLRNTWYALARQGEIGEKPAALTVLGENVVAYRKGDGAPVALEDACPHRKLPLSMGTRVGDTLVCGYHGLTFDGAGKCVAAPTQGRPPTTAKVKSYPLADRWGLTWIWMGDPAKADPSRIITIDNAETPGWRMTSTGSMDCACSYLFLTDNLLDPSHVAWVHVTSFAAPGTESTPLEVAASDRAVIVSRWMMNTTPPGYYAPLLKFEGNCDRLQHYEVRYPSLGVNKSVFTPAGTGGHGKPLDPRAYMMVSYHFLTPLDEGRTRYFWLQNRNTDPDNEELTAHIVAGARGAFEEDRVVLEAVHKGMADKTTPHIDLGLDAGALRFRRHLQGLIDAEQGKAAT